MVLCVSGQLSPEKVLEIVDKANLGGYETVPLVKQFSEPSDVAKAYVEKEMHVGKPIFSIGIKDVAIPSDPVERYRRAETVNILLNMMFSEAGDFYLDMLEKGLVSPGFDVGYSSNEKTAYVMMSGESDDPKKLLECIKKQIIFAINGGLDVSDFERERKCMYASYVSEFDMTEDIAFLLNSYTWEEVELFSYPDMISSITFDDVCNVALEIFKEEFFTLSVVRPPQKGDS